NDEFLEWEQVYENQYYGTLKSEVDRIWEKGNHVIFDVDVVGGLNIKKKFGSKALAIFVKPPSVEELENRLRNRSTENEETLKKRLDKAKYELSFEKEFDIVLINKVLEEAIMVAQIFVSEFLKS
ncbi:MAG: guanylate kinase, partial [Flavobacterium sp.]|nr:guanylate kinase [Flavobacterium sp.]